MPENTNNQDQGQQNNQDQGQQQDQTTTYNGSHIMGNVTGITGGTYYGEINLGDIINKKN
ncbi:hypothetical protein OG897_39940 [Streptomyces sp. NBC_00237]|uniref:hypothetical protein n=1 Tax=Streptomyces sp. NBC_00237 TaxID=2975687 RepID=UPI00225574F7|nr:hypothetical protein [Streptomyces sp. NBC_00237]MCX5207564.1 hypothetical protein [Streptomyces sp. NBC_00237]